MNTISRDIFEVEIVLLRTLRVKRNAGRGTPAKYLSVYWIILSLIPPVRNGWWFLKTGRFAIEPIRPQALIHHPSIRSSFACEE